ncbi:MAG: DNA-3-methyladenine glycosylase I [Hyphomicrobiaceae bacterium]|nr:DNA-3-methyladenine glycosylase I [Hyphomicrobiaceae bacterium]
MTGRRTSTTDRKAAAEPVDQLPAVVRCSWVGLADAEYQRYHDEEWGVPVGDDRALFEKMVLEGFQSGLSWLTILRKRQSFRDAFDGFAPERIARYGERDVARLMADAGIVRNRAKIEATIANARAFLALSEHESFAGLLWRIAREDRPAGTGAIVYSPADVPAASAASNRIAKTLKARGFRFVGPTTMYAFMQSVGMVNDHIHACHRHAACQKLQRAFKPPVHRGDIGKTS